jgi:hypothetical protein
MTRNDILTGGMLRQPHPDYGILSYGRWITLESLRIELIESGSTCGHTLTGIRWVMCSRPHDDKELVAALASADKISALNTIWQRDLHISEVTRFVEWWEAEITGQEAAATTHKPDTRLGKSTDQEEQTPTT